jgi:hypothetical protein
MCQKVSEIFFGGERHIGNAQGLKTSWGDATFMATSTR